MSIRWDYVYYNNSKIVGVCEWNWKNILVVIKENGSNFSFYNIFLNIFELLCIVFLKK